MVYVSQPLDTVKVKMQTFPSLYKNMGTCLVETFKRDGIVRGWYAGTLPAVLANVAENSVLFAGKIQFVVPFISLFNFIFCTCSHNLKLYLLKYFVCI